MTNSIPIPAANRIFHEVWSQYTLFAEIDPHDQLVINFMMDVEYALRTLYPRLSTFNRIRRSLLLHPTSLRSTRSALGAAFLDAGLWPVKSYFSK